MRKRLFFIILPLITGIIIPSVVNAQNNKHELSLSYGYCPSTEFMSVFETFSTFGIYSTKDNSSFGAVNLSYNYRVKKWLGLGISYTFSSSKDDVYGSSLFHSSDLRLGHEKYTYHTILPMAKFNWLNRNIVTLYSKIATGVVISTDKYTSESKTMDDAEKISEDKSTNIMFGFQFSPFGIEVGKQIAGYAELGIGNMGIIQVGIRTRF